MEIVDPASPVPPSNGTTEEKAAPRELKATFNLPHAVSLAVGQTIGSGES